MIANSQGPPQTQLRIHSCSLVDLVNQVILAIIAFGPAPLVRRGRKESLASAGLSNYNLGPSLLVGSPLVFLTLLITIVAGGLQAGRTDAQIAISRFWALLTYSVVGFSEEIVFHGTLQTKMVAWPGLRPGWIISSALMALGHISQRGFSVGMSLEEALISSVTLIPLSQLMGYILLRTENIVSAGMFHTVINWSAVL